MHNDPLSMLKKRNRRWYEHIKILWHGEDNSARDSEKNKKERKIEEGMGTSTSKKRQNRGLEISLGQRNKGKGGNLLLQNYL